MPRLKKKSLSMKQKEMKARRLSETSDEKVAKREEARRRMARLRAAETAEQTLTRRAVNATRLAKKRAAEIAKQKIEHRAVNAASFSRKKAAENFEQKIKRRSKNAASITEKSEHPCQLQVPCSLQRQLHSLACNQNLVISLMPALQERHFTSHQRHSVPVISSIGLLDPGCEESATPTPDDKLNRRTHE